MSLTILLHSSKTMVSTPTTKTLTDPFFKKRATAIHRYVEKLSTEQLQKSMHISEKLANEVHELFAHWRDEGSDCAAIESFRGDIFSGLRALDFTDTQRAFAQQHLFLLSGMYGLLRPYDAVCPYRLEAGYRFPDEPYRSMYTYWGDHIAKQLPADGPIINVTSAEYDALVLPFVNRSRVITPKFLTIIPGKTEPKFVAVHAKIARGAYARWLIQRGEDSAASLEEFSDLGYSYEPTLSTKQQPVYICKDFKGIGLSQRLV